MARQEVFIGSVGPYLYDDVDFPAGIHTTGPIRVDTAPDDVTEVLRLDDLGGSFTTPTFDAIQLVTGLAAPTHSEGLIFYDDDEKTLAVYNNEADVTLQLGQEEYIRATNKTGAQLDDGTLVYVDGAQGNRPTIAKAKSDAPVTSMVLAMTTHDIADNATGFCTTFGLVHGVDTSSDIAGTLLYLSDSVAGEWTSTPPTEPSFPIQIGTVITQNVNDGVIFVSMGPTDVSGHMVIQSLAINDTLSINVTPKTWATLTGILQFGDRSALSNITNIAAIISSNWYFDGASKRIETGFVTRAVFNSDDGSISFQNADTDTADSAVSFSTKLFIDNDGLVTITNIPANTDNTVVISVAGILSSDEIDPKVWAIKLVDYTGTPADNQIAVFTDGDTIEGDANFVWTGSLLEVKAGEIAINRAVADTGFGQILFQDADSTQWAIGQRNGDHNLHFYDATAGGADDTLFIEVTTGNVGIGDVVPAAKLEVNDNTAQVTLLVTKGNTSGNAVTISNSGSSRALQIDHDVDGTGTVDDIIRVTLDSSVVYVLDETGNVGIGTATPEATLHSINTSNTSIERNIFEGRRDGIFEAITIRARDGGSPTSAIGANHGGGLYFRGFDGTNFGLMSAIFGPAESTLSVSDHGGYLSFYTVDDSTTILDERMRIEHNGNVGVGITSPQEKLAVAGNLVLPKSSANGIKVDNTTPTFGFADLLGDQFSKNTGGTKPTLITYNGAVEAWKFSNGDEAFLTYHIPHDYVIGTDIFLHIHWSQNNAGATGGTIDFKYFAIYAKGHNQASGSTFTSTPITATFSSIDINDGASGLNQYQQQFTEVIISGASATAALFDRDDFEPDGVIELTLEMDANNLTGTPSDPFIHYVDIHYQTTGLIGTKNRAPDFYA